MAPFSVFDWNNRATRTVQNGAHEQAASMYVQTLKQLQQMQLPPGEASPSLTSRSSNIAEDEDEEVFRPPLTLLTVPANAELQGAHPELTVQEWNRCNG